MNDVAYAVVGTITKSSTKDGVLTFEASKATGPDLDEDGQRVDMNWAVPAMREWFQTGANLREMHQLKAVGKALTLEERDDGVYVSGKVVDPVAIPKIEHGILRQLSVGIRNPQLDFTQKALAPNGLINGGKIIEVTLCDRASNPTCDLLLGKAATDGTFEPAEEFRELDKAERVEHSHSHMHGERGHHRHPHNHGPGVAEHRSMDSDVAHNHKHTEEQDESLDQDDVEKALRAELTAVYGWLEKAKLSTEDRKQLPDSDFAIPEKAPGSGSYPINDEAHARDALARSSGKPEEARVRRAVKRKYPDMEVESDEKSEKAAKPPKPTNADPDPNHNGDDDRTPEGDTDHDYWNEDGTLTAKGRAAGLKEKPKSDCPDGMDKTASVDLRKLLSNPDAVEALRKALGIEAQSALQEEIADLKQGLEKALNVPGVTRVRPAGAAEVATQADRLRAERDRALAMADVIDDQSIAKSYRDLADQKTDQLNKLAS